MNRAPFRPAPGGVSVHSWRRLVRRRNLILGLWLGGIGVEIAIFPLMGVFPTAKYAILGVCGALTAVWLGACCAGIMLQARLEDHIKRTLRTKDTANLGCWIESLNSGLSRFAYPQLATKFHKDLRAGALELLPLFTEENACQLRAGERYELFKTLRGTDAEFIGAVVRAAPVFCDPRALPFLRDLASGMGAASGNPELAAEAQSSVDKLQARLARAGGTSGLLRASTGPILPDDSLLVPAHARGDADSRELVRVDTQERWG